ncbi:MAG TPA: tetratricopeptide repeat protein [Actinomycetes bacterium]
MAGGPRWSPPRELQRRWRVAAQVARDAIMSLPAAGGGREVAASLGQVLAESPAQPFLLHLSDQAEEIVGRTVELAEAQAALERGRRGGDPLQRAAAGEVPVVVVHGPPGIGTSAFAVQLARWARPLFPDGQLAVDLGQPGGAAGPGDALSELLQALGARPREVPDDLLERARRYRSLLADRRTLVLVERATDAEQVRALLPSSPGCAMIVTTRAPLGGLVTAARCRIAPLPERDAVELLARTVGRARVDDDPAAALAIVRWGGRHPLAVRVLGAWMRQHAGEALPLDRMAEDLRDRGSPGTGDDQRVGASLEIAHRSLSSEGKRVLRHVGLLPTAELDTGVVAALAGTTAEATVRALDELAEAALIEPVGQEGGAPPAGGAARWRVHELVWRFAADKAARLEPAALRRAACERMVAFYLDQADLAGAGGAVAVQERLDWLERERANLVAAVDRAALEQLNDLAWRLAVRCARFLDARHYWDAWLLTAERGVAAAEALGNAAAEAATNENLADANLRRGRVDEAVTRYERSVAQWRQRGEDAGLARALAGLGAAQERRGQLGKAVACYDESLALRRGLDDVRATAWALERLGGAHREWRNHSQAVSAYRESLRLYQARGDRTSEARVRTELALTYQQQGDARRALRELTRSLRAHGELGDDQGAALALGHLGEVQRELGQHNEAVRTFRQGQVLARSLGDGPAEVAVLCQLGEVLRELGQQEEAAIAFEQSADGARQLGDRAAEGKALLQLGMLRLGGRQARAAVAPLRRAVDLARGLGDRDAEAHVLEQLGLAHLEQGELGRAATAFEASRAVYERLGDIERAAALRKRLDRALAAGARLGEPPGDGAARPPT